MNFQRAMGLKSYKLHKLRRAMVPPRPCPA